MFGSVSLIYNAFAISVSERTKQFGLLSSIGATKRQLRQMVLFEAMIVSVIGIPLGICSGIAGIAITLHFIGNKFDTLINYSNKEHIEIIDVTLYLRYVDGKYLIYDMVNND